MTLQMPSTKRIEPAGVVVEDLALGGVAELSIVDDRLGSAGKAAVEVTVVGGEDDPVVADRFDDVRDFGLVGLA